MTSSTNLTNFRIVNDGVFNTITTSELGLPITQTIVGYAIKKEGTLVYTLTEQSVYVSNGDSWLPVGGTGATTTLSLVGGGTSLIVDGVGPTLSMLGITTSGSGLNISNTGTSIQLQNTGVTSISPGSGIGVSGGGGAITITNTSPAIVYSAGTGLNLTGTTFSNTGVLSVTSGSSNIVISGTASNPIISANYGAGTGINITGGNLIVNTSPASSVVLASPGSGVSLVLGGTGPSLSVKSLIAASGVSIVPGVNDVTIGGTYLAGTGINLSGTTFSNTGVLSVSVPDSTLILGGTAANPTIGGNYAAGSGISITGNVINNISPGILYLAGTGLNLSGVTFSNTGVLSVGAGNSTITIGGTSANPSITANYSAGTGISLTGTTFDNTGVLSLSGTTNQISVSASTGAITLSLPSNVTISSSLTVSGLTADSFLYSGTSGILTSTTPPTNGQLLIGSTGNPPNLSTLTPGTGISVTNGLGSISISNTGVLGVSGTGVDNTDPQNPVLTCVESITAGTNITLGGTLSNPIINASLSNLFITVDADISAAELAGGGVKNIWTPPDSNVYIVLQAAIILDLSTDFSGGGRDSLIVLGPDVSALQGSLSIPGFVSENLSTLGPNIFVRVFQDPAYSSGITCPLVNQINNIIRVRYSSVAGSDYTSGSFHIRLYILNTSAAF